jgi:hypothetical protein
MRQHDGGQLCNNVGIGDMSYAPHSFTIQNHNLGNQLYGILGNLNMFFGSIETKHSNHTYIHRQSW